MAGLMLWRLLHVPILHREGDFRDAVVQSCSRAVAQSCSQTKGPSFAWVHEYDGLGGS